MVPARAASPSTKILSRALRRHCDVLPHNADLPSATIASASPILGQHARRLSLPMRACKLTVPLDMMSGILLSLLNGRERADLRLISLAFGSLPMTSASMVGSRWDLTGLSLAWVAAYPFFFRINVCCSSHVLGTAASAIASKMSRSMASFHASRSPRRPRTTKTSDSKTPGL